MSTKQKRKSRKDYGIYYNQDDMDIKRKRPNLYKQHAHREKLYRNLFELSSGSDKYRKELRIKGLDHRFSEEIALTSWL